MTLDPLNMNQRIYPTKQYEAIEKKYNEELQSENEEKVNQKRTDSLNISAEARKLSPIVAKVNEGFYDRPDVVREVASRISQDMPPGGQQV